MHEGNVLALLKEKEKRWSETVAGELYSIRPLQTGWTKDLNVDEPNTAVMVHADHR